MDSSPATRPRPPRRLAALPHLGTWYLEWSNRNQRIHVLKILCLGFLGAALATEWLLWSHRARVAVVFDELQLHRVALAVLSAIVTFITVSHQRSVHTALTSRSWVVALPISARARRLEALTLILAPLMAVLLLVSGVSLLTGTTLAIAGLPAGGCLVTWQALLVGALLGGIVGLAFPPTKPVVPYPGSRYVPHRATRGRRPAPSLAALGIWPIRRMFALLQPKTLARTALPLMLMVPLQTAAAAAMIWLGVAGLITALLFLTISIAQVLRAARHWLKPLPLSSGRLRRLVIGRALLVAAGIAAVAVWLRWVGRA